MIIKAKTLKKLRNTGSFLFILVLNFIVFSLLSHAQGIDAGIGVIGNEIKLSSDDPRVMAARIIQIFLSLLGVITVVLIIYAGTLWMLSEGNEDKIDKAKKILQQTIIGLIIILASWGIVTFILNKLIGQANPIINEVNNTKHISLDLGMAALGNCTLESVYPTPGQTEVPRNTSILVTFKESINMSSVCSGDPCQIKTSAIQIYKEGDDNNPITGTATSTASSTILVITPDTYLGSALNNTHYFARLIGGTTGIKKKAVDQSIFATCASDSFKWEFTVSNKLDLTPPQITGVFPAPDDSTDTIEQSSFLAAASGGIGVINQGPQNYKEATITDPVPGTGSPEIDSSMIEDYHGQDKIFRVVIDASDLKAKLYRGFTLLGSADFFNKKITFPHYFSFTLKTDPSSGNSWDITVDPERLASTLTVGQTVYTFSDNNNGNNILIGGTPEETAANISDKLNGSTILNGNSEVKSLKSTPDWKFAVEARVAGAAGNNIVLDTNTPYSISVPQNAKLSGGSDGNSEVKIIGKKDQPRNSVIQINFDEPINPMTISGSATDLKEYLQVYNKEAGQDKVDGHACTGNNECLSFKCNADKCVGDFLAGKFVPASNYKTVEFISDNECGMNGCGEKIYCLPANSNIGVMVNAADLFKCTDDKKCSGFGSYKCLDDNLLSHKTCQTNIKDTRRNYPLFDINSSKKGLTDLANNSLDGNGDGYADGPGPKPFLANDPKSPDSIGDNYFWSFWINNQLLINSPKILSLVPNQGASTTATDIQITIPFNILMMASTIKTGSEVKVVDFGNGPESVTHKFLNVWSQTPQPLGYWAESNNKDAAVNGLLLDGWPDLTDIYIKHSNFGESITYNAQAGSGLKDIYQNCFKPSSGPGLNGVDCNASDGDPSCCFGVATSSISTTTGNCK